MRYLRLFGVLTLVIGGLASLSGLGCSASGVTTPPPPNTSGGAQYVGQGGTTSQDTSAGGTSSSGGVFMATGGAISCNGPEKACGSICVDTATAHDHCGDCNQPCGATQICVEGECRCPASNPDADAGPVTDYQTCAGKCVDILSDRNFCGACLGGEICLYDRCVNGKCGCLPTDIRCGEHNECVDKLIDRNNCGGCGIKCGQFEDCEQGECVEHCEQHNGKMCGDTCIDVMNDNSPGTIANCGDCGIPCPTDRFECKAGQCVCRATAVLPTVMHCIEPTSAAHLCVDTANDRRFCGNCDTACEPGKSCENSLCVCSSSSLQCPEGCFDATSDRNHCGACDKVCAAGYRCVSSNCVCNEGLNLCSDRCADYQNEPANCGGCGQACGTGQACTAGKCQCDAGLDLCSGNCFDLQTDEAHCGSCTTACSASQTCVAGKCTCGDGLTACGQDCVDAQNDALNCGDCNIKCGPTQMCQGGTCRTSVIEVRTKSQQDNKTQVFVFFNVCNAGPSALNLTGYSIKYWYTSDGTQTEQIGDIDYTPFTPKPTTVVTLMAIDDFKTDTDSVLQVNFGGGSLATGACTGDIQVRIHPKNPAAATSYGPQTGDYSYAASATAFTANPNVTAYNAQGLIIWGVEPPPCPATAECP